MTEDEVLVIIERIANRLWYKFKFGYHDKEDMMQQARLHAVKVLNDGRYDEKRPLENFLYTCVHNRLFNDKRDNYERPDKPCLKCPLDSFHNNECVTYSNILDCEWYDSWYKRNFSKKNIMKPIGIDGVNDEREANMRSYDKLTTNVMCREIIELIDREIPNDMRHDWKRMMTGAKLPKNHRVKLVQQITMILEEHNINVQEAW
jgi:hypothetical protein